MGHTLITVFATALAAALCQSVELSSSVRAKRSIIDRDLSEAPYENLLQDAPMRLISVMPRSERSRKESPRFPRSAEGSGQITFFHLDGDVSDTLEVELDNARERRRERGSPEQHATISKREVVDVNGKSKDAQPCGGKRVPLADRVMSPFAQLLIPKKHHPFLKAE